MFGGMLPMQVQVSPHANEDTAVAVDLVVVYDTKAGDELLKMTASQWFQARDQFLADHPKEVAKQSWEWVPGQAVPPQSINYRVRAQKVVLFADYVTDGAHRAVVPPQQPFRLVLGDRDLAVEAIQ